MVIDLEPELLGEHGDVGHRPWSPVAVERVQAHPEGQRHRHFSRIGRCAAWRRPCAAGGAAAADGSDASTGGSDASKQIINITVNGHWGPAARMSGRPLRPVSALPPGGNGREYELREAPDPKS